MTKSIVTRLFIGAGIAMIAGAVVAIVAVSIAIAGDVFVMSGSDVVGLQGGPLAWTSLVLGIAGVLAITGGLIAGLVSWIGALLNTWQLESKAWFIGLLLLGIFNLGFFAMVAYIIAGPDGEASRGTARRAGTLAGMTDRTAAPSMTGKTVLITGGTAGIGRAAAVGLASMGARVGITGRDRDRAEGAAAEIVRASGNPAVDVFVADMSSQAEVRRLAGEVLAAYPRLDVLLNNVGGFWAHRHVTADGLEHTFALNHLAPFLLTDLLLERLVASAPARVVTVSSGAQSMGRIDFDDLMGEGKYSGQRAYNQSKLANVMFTYELARRLEGTGVTATVLHPGVTSTGFGAEDTARGWGPLIAVMRPFMKKPEQGAETSDLPRQLPGAAGLTGRYFADAKPRSRSKSSYDTATTARLWRVSADLVGVPATH